jgi:hypothetical protein
MEEANNNLFLRMILWKSNRIYFWIFILFIWISILKIVFWSKSLNFLCISSFTSTHNRFYFLCPSTHITRSGKGRISSNKKILGILPEVIPRTIRLQWSRISEELTYPSENYLRIFPKLIPRNIHSKTPIFLRKNSCLYFLWTFYYKLSRNVLGFFSDGSN